MAAKVRETGIAAIGAIPVSWKLERLNNVAELFGRIGWQGLTSDEYTDEGAYLVTGTDFRDGYIDWSSCVHVSEDRWEEAWQIKLQEGDLLISKDGTIGKLAIVSDLSGHASLNSGLMRIVPRSNGYITKYLYYVLQTDVFYDWYREIDAGASTIKHLFQGDFIHFVYPSPPIEEQEAIAEELDKRTKELDHAINLVSRQLETLDGYRKSLIQETVTKGLNHDAKLKPSGIDWIGDIPLGWSVRKTKHLASISSGSTPDRNDFDYWDGDIPWLKTGELQNNVIIAAEEGVTRKALRDCSLRMYDVDTVLVAMYGQGKTRGMTGLLGIPSTTNQACAALVADRILVKPKYLWLAFQAAYDAIREEAQGSGQPNLSADIIARFHIPLPPLSEQEIIASYLLDKLPTVDRIIAGKRKQLETLRAQRQSLIYEYVTGKRRVV